METVLFVCTHNSSRSQMAEGLLRARYRDRYKVHSAGTEPGGVNPFAVAVMDEIGIDISGHASEHVDTYREQSLDIVVTVCDDAAENCPYIPARKENLHRGFADPSAVEGTDEEKLVAFRRIRNELSNWIDATFGWDGEAPDLHSESTLLVERARSDDLDAVCDLLEVVDLPTEDLTPTHLEHFLVCRDGSGLVGIVGLEPYGDVALLRSLAVAPGARNQGLGARLVDAIEQQAQDDGIRSLYLLTTTAAEYFRAHGYEPITREALPKAIQQSEEATRLCPSSATSMQKSLTSITEESA